MNIGKVDAMDQFPSHTGTFPNRIAPCEYFGPRIKPRPKSHVIFTGAAEKLRWKGISESLGLLLAKLIALSQEGKPARGAGLSEKELEALKAPGARGFTWWWDDRSLEF